MVAQDRKSAQPTAGSYSRAERVILEPFRRGMAWLVAPIVNVLVRLGISPNTVSFSQIPIGFGAAALIPHAPRVAFGMFLGALLLDAIDGALARKQGASSTFGGLVDQVADHVREITMVGGLVAAGAMRGEIGVAYALLYPLVNLMLYIASINKTEVPVAIKTWMSFYPFMFIFLLFGTNWLDYSGAVSAGLMALTSAIAIFLVSRHTTQVDAAKR